MIGRVNTSSSFRDNLNYCILDKRQSNSQEVVFKDRAEILYYHQCHGKMLTLNRQFQEVAHYRENICKPVMCISLSMPPGEPLPKSKLVELAKECAEHMDFAEKQYIVILHKDVAHQHIHIVANRIGYDGAVTSDSYDYKRINEFCRAAEVRHGLTRTLAPKKYRSAEERLLPRQHYRLDDLKENIRQALLQSNDMEAFKRRMEERDYIVYQSEKGVAFRTDQHVIFRGCDAGYPYKKIQSILSQELIQRQEAERQRLERELRQRQMEEYQSQRQRNHYSQHLSL